MDRQKVLELARGANFHAPVSEGEVLRFAALIEREVRGDAEPVAWATFDGEGGYEYRSYAENEDYAEQWAKRNPNHVDWVKTLYPHPAPAVEFEFSDKGKAEIVICPKGLTYGVRCIDFPKVFAQFTFESDAKRFAEIFNGTVAPRVESPSSGGGGGFESRPVPTIDGGRE